MSHSDPVYRPSPARDPLSGFHITFADRIWRRSANALVGLLLLALPASAEWEEPVAVDTAVDQLAAEKYVSTDGTWLYAVVSSQNQIAEYDPRLIRSRDGGLSWERTGNPAFYGYVWPWTVRVAATPTDLHMVWGSSDFHGVAHVNHARSVDQGATWSVVTRIDGQFPLDSTPNPIESPDVAGTASAVHVVWSEQEGGEWKIVYSRSEDDGQSWSSAEQVSAAGSSSEGAKPQLSADGNRLYVTWRNQDDQQRRYLRVSDDGGKTWSDELLLTINDRSPYLGTHRLQADHGTIHATLHFPDSTGRGRMQYRRSMNAGTIWSDAVALSDGDSLGVHSLAVVGDHVHVAWVEHREHGPSELRYRTSDDGGGTWKSEQLLFAASGLYHPYLLAHGKDLYCFYVVGDTLYQTRSLGGNSAVKSSTSRGGHTVAVSPNPIRSNTTISVDGGLNVPLTVTIVDLRGRTIASLSDESGSSFVTWNACDRSGAPVPPGPYHCIVTAGSVVTARVLHVIR